MKKLITLTALSFLYLCSNAQLVRPTGDLNVKRAFHQMQPLPNGKVLIFGGQTTDNLFQPVLHAVCELYDPATELWTNASSLNTSRSNFASVVLANGKILAIGGSDGTAQLLASVEEYDPATGNWTNKGSLMEGRQNIDAVLMDNGTVLVMGHDPNSYETSDDGGATWDLHDFPGSFGYAFPEAPSLVSLSNGSVLSVGNQAGPYANWAVTISPLLAHDTTNNPLAVDHPNAGVAELQNGKILIAGGTASGTCELYDPATDALTSTGSFNTSHISCPLMTLSDGRVAAFNTGNTFQDIILEIYDPSAGTWSYYTGHDFTGLSAYTVAPLPNNNWLIAGGTEILGVASTGSLKSFIFDETATGIDKQDKEDVGLVYNTSSGLLNVKLTSATLSNHLVLMNTAGQTLQEYVFSGSSFSVQVPDISSGIYVVMLQTPEGVWSRKFVKR